MACEGHCNHPTRRFNLMGMTMFGIRHCSMPITLTLVPRVLYCSSGCSESIHIRRYVYRHARTSSPSVLCTQGMSGQDHIDKMKASIRQNANMILLPEVAAAVDVYLEEEDWLGLRRINKVLYCTEQYYYTNVSFHFSTENQ
jgi:hypothetical protein